MSDAKKDGRGQDSTDALKRRGDNVGQSGRWGRQEEGARRYGNEERWHSTDHAGTEAHEPSEAGKDDSTARSANESGSSASAREGAVPGMPIAPGESRWLDERAEGQDKEYGRGGETDPETKKAGHRRR